MANKYVCVDVYTVRAGDTLYSIAQSYNVDVGLLMRVNRVRNPYNLRIGTKLCIPGMAEGGAPQVPDQPQAPAPLPDVNPDVPQEPGPDASPRPDQGARCRMMHKVESGDTLYMIAKKYKVTLDALMDANPDIDPYNMQIGMEICVPN